MAELQIKFITNTLQHYAVMYLEKPIEERILKAINMTNIFKQELIKMIKAGEYINININGWQTSGKSTVMMALGDFITEEGIKQTECRYCKMQGRKHEYKDFGINTICRDDQEYTAMMKDASVCHCILGVDEHNELEMGGINATIEQALRNQFSEVQAQRYVHKITCSPQDQPDKTSNILLEVVQADKERKVTHCLLYYKLIKGGFIETQLLGHVNIDVSNVIDKPWYMEYRQQKMEKWDLILKHGIFRPRLMEYASIIKLTVQQLKPLAVIGALKNKDIIANYIQKGATEEKIPLSILGLSELTNEANGIISLYKTIEMLNRQENIIKKKFQDNKITLEIMEDSLSTIVTTRNEVAEAVKMQMEQLDKMIQINSKYNYARKNDTKGTKEQ